MWAFFEKEKKNLKVLSFFLEVQTLHHNQIVFVNLQSFQLIVWIYKQLLQITAYKTALINLFNN